MFTDVYHQMLEEMSSYHRPKEELIYEYVQKRLSQSLKSYYDQLRKSAYYIQYNNKTKRHKIFRDVEKIQ